MLLTTAAVTFVTCAAQAKDFTGSLFLPSKGEILSDTELDWSRTKYKGWNDTDKDLMIGEELTYGVTDNFSVYGAILNAFNFAHITSRQYNNEHNFAYNFGGKYNYTYGRFLSQVGLGYTTFQPKSWFGHRAGIDSDWYKEINFEAQAGYVLCNGVIPYVRFEADSPIDQSHRVIDYTAFAGVHKAFDKYAVDGGVRYEFVTHGDNTNQVYLEGEANYFVTPKVAVGLHGDYMLAGSEYKDDATLGAQLKVLF